MAKVCCAREAFDERPCNRSSHYCEGSEALATLWVDVPVDILGVVPCSASSPASPTAPACGRRDACGGGGRAMMYGSWALVMIG